MLNKLFKKFNSERMELFSDLCTNGNKLYYNLILIKKTIILKINVFKVSN